MRPFASTIPVADALRLIDEVGLPIERVETVVLDEASGRALAADAVARQDVPPFDRAVMDGYAVRAEDTFGATRHSPRRFRCIDTIYSGQTPERPIGPGECAEIATGAPLPNGANAVVMVEDTQAVESSEIQVFSSVSARQHVAPRGSDIATGQVVLRSGDLLTPSRVGALAALGLAGIDVFERPRVAVVPTGNEIIEPGEPLAPGQIYDINKFSLSAVIREHGGAVEAYPPVGDTIEELESAIEACLAADLLVFSGGSSVGSRDLLVDVVGRRGTIIFHGIAVKPGKPTLLGTIHGKPVLGMPGNPTSCLSNAYLFLIPMLRRLGRLPPHGPRTITVPLAGRIVSTTGRHQFYTVRIVDGRAIPAFKGSGDITSMSYADGYIEIAAGTSLVEEGTIVEVKLFA